MLVYGNNVSNTVCTDNNIGLILNLFQLLSIDTNLFKNITPAYWLSMKNGFNKVQKNISRKETANIKFHSISNKTFSLYKKIFITLQYFRDILGIFFKYKFL